MSDTPQNVFPLNSFFKVFFKKFFLKFLKRLALQTTVAAGQHLELLEVTSRLSRGLRSPPLAHTRMHRRSVWETLPTIHSEARQGQGKVSWLLLFLSTWFLCQAMMIEKEAAYGFCFSFSFPSSTGGQRELLLAHSS